MNNLKISIQSPPPGGQILSERRGEAVVISGKSQGVPRELYSPEELGVMGKTLSIKEKLSPTSSEANIDDLLAQQVFDWAIEVSGSQVTFSSGALRDDYLFNLRDVRRILRSAGGCLLVELSHLEGEKFKTQVLAGTLGPDEAEWLQGALIQIFDLDQDGVAKPRVEEDLKSARPESFQLDVHAGGSRVEIQHRTKVLHRVLPFAIGAIVLSVAGIALLGGGGGGEGVLPDLVQLVGDHPVWSKVVRYLIIAGIIFASFRVVQIVLGTLKMGVDKHSFEIKKGILGAGVSRAMSRSQMKGLAQSSWTEIQRDASGDPTRIQYWKLEFTGDKAMTLLTDETDPKDSDWLGQFLADWYEIPFVKTSLPDKH
jgi:hypothetical protein